MVKRRHRQGSDDLLTLKEVLPADSQQKDATSTLSVNFEDVGQQISLHTRDSDGCFDHPQEADDQRQAHPLQTRCASL